MIRGVLIAASYVNYILMQIKDTQHAIGVVPMNEACVVMRGRLAGA
jgi:hypothetical protein